MLPGVNFDDLSDLYKTTALAGAFLAKTADRIIACIGAISFAGMFITKYNTPKNA